MEKSLELQDKVEVDTEKLKEKYAVRFVQEADRLETGFQGKQFKPSEISSYKEAAECLRGQNDLYPELAAVLWEGIMVAGRVQRDQRLTPDVRSEFSVESHELSRLLVDYAYSKGNSHDPIFTVRMVGSLAKHTLQGIAAASNI